MDEGNKQTLSSPLSHTKSKSMAKKVITVSLIVDTDNAKKEEWHNAENYIVNEVNVVFESLFNPTDALNNLTKPSTVGRTSSGSKYTLTIKKAVGY